MTRTEMPRLIRSGTPARYWISLVTSRPSKNTTQGARADRLLRAWTKYPGRLLPSNGTSTISILTSARGGESVEAIDRGAIGIERGLVLRSTKAFARLIIVIRAE